MEDHADMNLIDRLNGNCLCVSVCVYVGVCVTMYESAGVGGNVW